MPDDLTDAQLAALDRDSSEESGMAGIPNYSHVRRAVVELRRLRSTVASLNSERAELLDVPPGMRHEPCWQTGTKLMTERDAAIRERDEARKQSAERGQAVLDYADAAKRNRASLDRLDELLATIDRLQAERDAALAGVARLTAPTASPAPLTVPECSGVTARWCPRCGDCACDPESMADPDDMDDPRCPLHSPSSEHAEDGAPDGGR